jgi:hypothetical protein
VKERGEERKGEGESGERICRRREFSRVVKESLGRREAYEEKGTGYDEEPDVVCSSTVERALFQHLAVPHA